MRLCDSRCRHRPALNLTAPFQKETPQVPGGHIGRMILCCRLYYWVGCNNPHWVQMDSGLWYSATWQGAHQEHAATLKTPRVISSGAVCAESTCKCCSSYCLHLPRVAGVVGTGASSYSPTPQNPTLGNQSYSLTRSGLSWCYELSPDTHSQDVCQRGDSMSPGITSLMIPGNQYPLRNTLVRWRRPFKSHIGKSLKIII